MLELDIRTLLVVTALVSTGSAVALLFLWRAQKQQNGTGFWALGMSLVAMGSLLISARGYIPDFFSLVIANSLFVIGFLLILRGIRIFTGTPPLLFLDIGLPPIAALLFYYFNYIEPNLNIRIAVLSSCFVIICSLIVLTLIRDKDAPWRGAGLAVAMVYGLFGLSYAVRGSIALLSPFEYTFMSASSSSVLVFLSGIFMLGGSAITLILLIYATLESQLRIVSRAVNQSASSIIITDTKGRIDYINPALLDKTGYSAAELIGENPRILASGKTPAEEYSLLWKTLSAGETWRGEFYNRKKNGELYWEIASVAPVKQRNGKVSHYVAIKEDITALKVAEERILHMANHDLLTGLPTRRLSMDRLESGLAMARRNKTKLALLYVDIDGFKVVNDNCGHNVGDQVLKEISKRFCACVREIDTVARVGGDEFLIILTNIEDLQDVISVAKELLKEVTQPYPIEISDIDIGASIGVAIYPDDGVRAQELVNLADQAMYEVKRKGKNSYAFVERNGSKNMSSL